MVKNLKRVLAIVLSFTTLFFKGPVCFSMNEQEMADNSKGNTLKYPLIPMNKSEVEISYAARRINDADLGRSLNNSDHSKVTVPVMNFFLYPPKSVKELFEVKDKASAFFSGNATMHTDVGHRVEGIDCCCSGCNATLKATFLGVVALISSINVVTAIYLICRDARAKEIFQACSDGFLGICFLILTGYTLRQLRVTFSKSCCDCYPYKSSDYGCSFGYGCCSDGNSCVGCVNVCNCGEENGCMECCPCDNGGFAIDFCGSYGVGGCCTKPIYKELAKTGSEVLSGIVDDKYFDELLSKIDDDKIRTMHENLFSAKDSGEMKGCVLDIFMANSLIFSKYKPIKDKITVHFGGSKELRTLRMADMLGRITGQEKVVNVDGQECVKLVVEGGDPEFDGFIGRIAERLGNLDTDMSMAPIWKDDNGGFYKEFENYFTDEKAPTLGNRKNFEIVIIGNFCRFCDSLHRRYVYLQKRQQN